MFGKIIQLLGVPMEDGFRIVEGVESNMHGNFDTRFAMLKFDYPTKTYKNYIRGGHLVTDKDDGFKDILISTCTADELSEKDIEEYLFVIIPYSDPLETTAKVIAGRLLTEAILVMHSGDIVKVSKGGGLTETYMAVQAGNELFLIKKTR